MVADVEEERRSTAGVTVYLTSTLCWSTVHVAGGHILRLQSPLCLALRGPSTLLSSSHLSLVALFVLWWSSISSSTLTTDVAEQQEYVRGHVRIHCTGAGGGSEKHVKTTVCIHDSSEPSEMKIRTSERKASCGTSVMRISPILHNASTVVLIHAPQPRSNPSRTPKHGDASLSYYTGMPRLNHATARLSRDSILQNSHSCPQS